MPAEVLLIPRLLAHEHQRRGLLRALAKGDHERVTLLAFIDGVGFESKHGGPDRRPSQCA
jgi:hypothetical protein